MWWANADTLPAAWHCLSPAEQTHAQRLGPLVQRRFVAGRAALRTILGRYLALPPHHIQFVVGVHGKPRLSTSPLHFSVAHAGPGWLLALTDGGPLGVDVAELTLAPPEPDMVRHGLTAWQARRVLALPAAHQMPAFCRYWTANEARLKADGRGLGGAGVVALPGWRVRHARPAPGFLAALAVPAAAPWPITRRWQWG